jgi:hypothetical protein
MNSQTLAAIKAFGQRNPGNEAVSGAVNDLLYNSLSARLQTDSDESYALRMMPLSLEYQRGSQAIATEADMRKIAAEGGVLRDLTEQQGKIQTGITKIGAQAALGVASRQAQGVKATARAGVQASRIGAGADRYGYDQQRESTQYAADRGVDTAKIGAKADVDIAGLQLKGTQYSADRQVDATRIGADADKYGYDRQLEGTRDTNRSQEDQRRIQGDEDRKTLTQGTDETLRLRADARGAIASKGRRFFG